MPPSILYLKQVPHSFNAGPTAVSTIHHPFPLPPTSQTSCLRFFHHSELVSALQLCTCCFLWLVHIPVSDSLQVIPLYHSCISSDATSSERSCLTTPHTVATLAPWVPTSRFMVFIAPSAIWNDLAHVFDCVYCSSPLLECECHEGRNLVLTCSLFTLSSPMLTIVPSTQ